MENLTHFSKHFIQRFVVHWELMLGSAHKQFSFYAVLCRTAFEGFFVVPFFIF